jgi:aerobic C4-dicarboxylate transport protein
LHGWVAFLAGHFPCFGLNAISLLKKVIKTTYRRPVMTSVISPKISKNPIRKSPKETTGKPFYKSLLFQVLFAIFLGIAFGAFFPKEAIAMKPLGDGFINLIKMLIAPIIFCTLVTGIAGMGDMKQVGRVGAKAILWFEIVTTVALLLGLVMAKIFEPGGSMNIDIASFDASAIKEKIATSQMTSTVDFFLNIIPHTMVGAFAEGEILQVLLIAIIFSMALTRMGATGKGVLTIIEDFSHVLFKMVDIVTALAPIGAFGAMAYTIGKFGFGSLKDLILLIVLFYATGAIFIFFILGPVIKFYCKLSVLQFLRYIREEILIVLGTSSSETVLPRMMEKLVAMGCGKPIVGLVVPAGYSFNLDGSSIYFTMASLFIAHATNTEITMVQELTLLGVLLITSKGAAGVTGSAFIVLAATLTSMNLMPAENLAVGLALIFAIDRFMSTGRAIINLIGNGLATIVVAKWENGLDYELAQNVLSGKVEADLKVLEK